MINFVRINEPELREFSERIGIPGPPKTSRPGRFWGISGVSAYEEDWEMSMPVVTNDLPCEPHECVGAASVIRGSQRVWVRTCPSRKERGEWKEITSIAQLADMIRQYRKSATMVENAHPFHGDLAGDSTFEPNMIHEFFIEEPTLNKKEARQAIDLARKGNCAPLSALHEGFAYAHSEYQKDMSLKWIHRPRNRDSKDRVIWRLNYVIDMIEKSIVRGCTTLSSPELPADL